MLFQILIAAKIIHQLLYNLYLWQLKEYRIDRFSEHLQRKHDSFSSSWLHLTILAPISLKNLPKPTYKALFIFAFSCFVNILAFNPQQKPIFFASLLVSPLVVYAGILFLSPFEYAVRKAVYKYARYKINSLKEKHNLIVIGIVGSYGKTTTKNILSHIMSSKFNTITTEGSINTPLGISNIIIKQVSKKTELLIIEMGAYKKGEIKEICHIAKPSVAIITGIGTQHLGLFGNQQNLIQAKSEIVYELENNGALYINKNSKIKPILPKKPIFNITYYDYKKIPTSIKKNIPKNIPLYLRDCLAPAILIAASFNIDQKKIIDGVKKIKIPSGRGEVVAGINNSLIIDDSFSGSIEGLEGAINTMKKYKNKKKIIILSPFIELGTLSKKTHKKIGMLAASINSFLVVTSEEYFQHIKAGFGKKNNKIILEKNPNQILTSIENKIDKNTIILLEGRVNPQIKKLLFKKNV